MIGTLLNLDQGNPLRGFLHRKVYDDFIEAFDGIDNGISQYETDSPPRYKSSTDLSTRVGRLNPRWNEQDVDVQARFEAAVALTGSEFSALVVDLFKTWLPARSIVEQALQARFQVDPSGLIIVVEQFCPWQDHLFTLEREQGLKEEEKPVYCLFSETTPQGVNWRIRAVPPYGGTFDCRFPLPEPWRGVRDDALSTLTGIPGCVFVHASGFIGGTKTKEGALEMARKALQIRAETKAK